MHKSLIIFNGNLKTRMTTIEVAFTYMPSGFYSGLCADSPCQLGLLTPLRSARGGNAPTTEPTPTSPNHLSHQANSHSLVLDKQPPKREASHCPANSCPAFRLTCGPSDLHTGPSITHWTHLSQEPAKGTIPLPMFLFAKSKSSF